MIYKIDQTKTKYSRPSIIQICLIRTLHLFISVLPRPFKDRGIGVPILMRVMATTLTLSNYAVAQLKDIHS